MPTCVGFTDLPLSIEKLRSKGPHGGDISPPYDNSSFSSRRRTPVQRSPLLRAQAVMFTLCGHLRMARAILTLTRLPFPNSAPDAVRQ